MGHGRRHHLGDRAVCDLGLGNKSAAERAGARQFLTTPYTDLHGWKRWDFFLVVFNLAV